MKRLTWIFPFLLLIASRLPTAAQTGLQEDKKLVESLLLVSSHNGDPKEFVTSQYADTARLHPKLNILARNWNAKNHRRDSVKLENTLRVTVDGADKKILLVILRYQGKDWDEILLLLHSKDNYILDIANPQDVFLFDPAKRTRYYNQREKLYTFFQGPGTPKEVLITQEEALRAAKNVVRLVNAGKKDSLYQWIAYTERDNPARKYRQEACRPTEAKDRVKVNQIYNEISGMFSGPETIYIEGGLQRNNTEGTCSFRVVCNGTKNTGYFSFVVVNGRYLLTNFM